MIYASSTNGKEKNSNIQICEIKQGFELIRCSVLTSIHFNICLPSNEPMQKIN